ncbi:uncharacterized protein LOC129939623 [Eupeodes corollae]|uniref:uncharacterized protein LOC129939623 n=1 Tax=Eupeodes corollae TaxID=290404 RepID=UPI0024934FE6|nr:uncharacterized protein LOC129939623 [Eupeodes corollae]
MNFLAVFFAICMSISLVSGQFFGGFDRRFSLNAIPNDFSGNGIRDARQDRGPVVFPPPPRDGPMESSGVVVGASGFGFVPPSQSQYYETPSQPSLDYFNSQFFRYF